MTDPIILPETQSPAGRSFTIEAIYLKDCSFESPASPAILGTPNLAPELKITLQTLVNGIRDNPDLNEVVLSITLEARWQERVVFLAEIHQAGVFRSRGFSETEKGPLLGAHAPSLLYPYARELLGSLVSRGGFPPVILQPMDFDALYQQHQTTPSNSGPAS
jgi:preprotein translocase subunit SecB